MMYLSPVNADRKELSIALYCRGAVAARRLEA
jgi:hypothetical protein